MDYKYIKKIIFDKNIGEEKLEKVERILQSNIKYEKGSNNKMEIYLGKLYYIKQEYNNAKEMFKKALKKNKNTQSAYIGLYKISVVEKDWEEAYKYLNSYKKINLEKNKYINTDLVESILNKIFYKNNDLKEINTDFYMTIQIKNQRLKSKYKELVNLYILGDYDKCYNTIEECEKIVNEENIHIEFTTLKELLKEIIKISKQEENKKRKSLIDKYIKEQNYMKAANIFETYLEQKQNKRIKIPYMMFSKLIELDQIEKVELLLTKIDISKSDKKVFYILKNKLKNKKEYNLLNDKQKKIYQDAIEYGREYYQIGDLQTAYDIYCWGSYVTQQPIFLYYIGKMLYKAGNLDESMFFFNKYIDIGDDKLSKSYHYLANIYRCQNRRNKSAKCVYIMEELNIFMGENNYNNRINQKNHKYDQEIFLKQNDLLETIKKLYQTNQISAANQRLKKLEQKKNKTEEEKETLQTLIKNKKLYINQSH